MNKKSISMKNFKDICTKLIINIHESCTSDMTSSFISNDNIHLEELSFTDDFYICKINIKTDDVFLRGLFNYDISHQVLTELYPSVINDGVDFEIKRKTVFK